MGLIKALTESTSSALGDQFKEFVTCPEVDNKNVLIVRGKVEHGKGNKNPSEGVISNGSKIAIPHIAEDDVILSIFISESFQNYIYIEVGCER